MEAYIYNWQDFGGLAPIVLLTISGSILLLSEAFLKSRNRGYQATLSAILASFAGLVALSQASAPARELFAGFARADGFSAVSTALLCFALALFSLTATSFLKEFGAERGEFHALGHLATAGMGLLVYATDLVTFFIALEAMSLATYAMTAYLRHTPRPAEAGLKYFVLGSFSSAILLFGVALFYGVAGSTRYTFVAEAVTRVAQEGNATHFAVLAAGVGLFAIGVLFKVAAVPFHMWAPDVYQGAPTPVTGFMATAVKSAAMVATVRVFYVAFADESLAQTSGDSGWTTALSAIAVITMIGGNIFAVVQRSVKRMLAYSSISHAGYLLVGVIAGAHSGARDAALSATLFYLVTYSAAAIGAFGVVAALERRSLPELDDDSRYDGLAQRHPVLALAMTVFLLSTAGIPPAAGFAGKLFVFRAAMDAGLTGLVVVGVLTSVIGLYYYLRVIVLMYMRPIPEGLPAATRSSALGVGLAVAAVATLLFGVGPNVLIAFTQHGTNIVP